jgi:hypothetical protein
MIRKQTTSNDSKSHEARMYKDQFPKSWHKLLEIAHSHSEGVQADLSKRETPHEERAKAILTIERNNRGDIERAISDAVEEPA